MFSIGQEYKRKEEIHGKYGGQTQGGISTPRNHPIVLIFTSDAGEQHGYKDEYREDGTFWYTGEGQIGDMKMSSGNKAILEHSNNGKMIHIFEYTRKAYVRYVGFADCIGFHEELRPDREGNQRRAFVFHLDVNPVANSSENGAHEFANEPGTLKNLSTKSIEELRIAALQPTPKHSTIKQRVQITRYRSKAIKQYVLSRSKGKCEGCNKNAPFDTKSGPFLECHHVYRLSDGGPDHPCNVVALCPNCHRRAHFAKDAIAFNYGLISIALKKGS